MASPENVKIGLDSTDVVEPVYHQKVTKVPPGIVGLYGPPGSVKTTTSLSWPKKIELFDFDLGAHRAWKFQDMVDSGEVIHHRMLLPKRSITTRWELLEGFQDAWRNFNNLFEQALQNPDTATIVLDTATMTWKLIQDSFLEESQKEQLAKGTPPGQVIRQLIQVMFGPPNLRMRTVLQQPVAVNKWLVLVMHDTDEYVPVTMGGMPQLDREGRPMQAPSGKRIPDGFKYTVGTVDWLFVSRLEDQSKPHMRIEKSGMGLDLVKMDIADFNFEKLEQRLQMLGRI